MSTTIPIDPDVVEQGWRVLVEQLGIQKATQFVNLLERGKGDSIQEINDYWGDAGIDEIHDRVIDWKTSQR
jgi:hypothetical protein